MPTVSQRSVYLSNNKATRAAVLMACRRSSPKLIHAFLTDKDAVAQEIEQAIRGRAESGDRIGEYPGRPKLLADIPTLMRLRALEARKR